MKWIRKAVFKSFTVFTPIALPPPLGYVLGAVDWLPIFVHTILPHHPTKSFSTVRRRRRRRAAIDDHDSPKRPGPDDTDVRTKKFIDSLASRSQWPAISYRHVEIAAAYHAGHACAVKRKYALRSTHTRHRRPTYITHTHTHTIVKRPPVVVIVIEGTKVPYIFSRTPQ